MHSSLLIIQCSTVQHLSAEPMWLGNDTKRLQPQSTSMGFQVTAPSLSRSSSSSLSMSSLLISKPNTSILERTRSGFSDFGRGMKLGSQFNVIEQDGKDISAPVLERPTNENLCRILTILSKEFGISERKKGPSRYTFLEISCSTGFSNFPLTRGVYA